MHYFCQQDNYDILNSTVKCIVYVVWKKIVFKTIFRVDCANVYYKLSYLVQHTTMGRKQNEKTLQEKEKKKREDAKLRMQKYRGRLYKDAKKHKEVKEKDNARWKLYYKTKTEQMTPQEKNEKQKYERLKKRKQRQRKKDQEAGLYQMKELEEEKSKLRKYQRKASKTKRKLIVKVDGLLKKQNLTPILIPVTNYGPSTSKANEEEGPSVSEVLWNTLTPQTKLRAARSIQASTAAKGMSKKFRDELGININRKPTPPPEKGQLQKDVEDFMNRDDITVMCPDERKKIDVGDKSLQLRYRRSALDILHSQFQAETNVECSLRAFQLYIPKNVIKPSPDEWGTCKCMTCENPQLMYEALKRLNLKGLKLKGTLEAEMEDVEDLLRKLDEVKDIDNKPVMYNQWLRKVNVSKKSGKESKVTRKEPITSKSLKEFLQKFRAAVSYLQDHKRRVHMQYKGFKHAREQAAQSEGEVACLQVDWSENKR